MSKIVILLSIQTACLSQENIFTADKLQRGLYLSFEEFINNSPSITSKFEIVSKGGKKDFLLAGGRFNLVFQDTLLKKSFIRQKVWGLCTGDSIYVNALHHRINFEYAVLKEIGRYCYFEARISEYQRTGRPPVGAIEGAVFGSKWRSGFILNVNNGEFFELDYNLMEIIFDSDPDLLNRYKEEKRYHKQEVMLSYLREYNQRNRFEIDLLYQKPEDYSGEVVLFRKIRKEDDDELKVSVDNGDVVSIPPGKSAALKVKNTNKIELCIVDGECFDFKGVRLKTIYVEISKREGEIAAKAIHVEKKVADYYLKRLKYIDQKRN